VATSRRDFLKTAGLCAGGTALWAGEAAASPSAPSGAASLETGENEILLTAPGILRCRFVRTEARQWKTDTFSAWNHAGAWDDTLSPAHGEFLFLGATPDFDAAPGGEYLHADAFEPISRDTVTGVRFSGQAEFEGAALRWSASYFFDASDTLPLLHCETTYAADRDVAPGHAPKVITRTLASDASGHASMAHVMGYEPDEKPILIERGYPLVWLHSRVGDKTHNCLLVIDVAQDSPAGRYFLYNRSAQAPHFTYWAIGSMKKWEAPEEISKYYWAYRDPKTGLFPEETGLIANREYTIRHSMLLGLGHTMKQFQDLHLAKALDHICSVERVPFWSTDWDACARGHIREFRDDDQHAGDRYVDGFGYYSAPKKCTMSHGPGNVCWHGTAGIIHGILYYTWATGDRESFDFYTARLANVNLPKWAENTAGNKGWINEFWIQDKGYTSWSSMFGTLDFGAHSLYHCHKLTGDPTYWNLFKRLIDYTRDVLVKDRRSLGEHWVDKDEQWFYMTPESGFTEAVAVAPGDDPGDYAGALAIYAYLCLLVHQETGERSYREQAFSYIDHINTFRANANPHRFWTLVRNTKPNGFGFACLANVRRYELTQDPQYLDIAEEWFHLLLTMYHLRDEGGNETGLAHAGGLGLQDYVCVPAFETIEPVCLAAALLRHRVNPALLRLLAIADRRYLIVYGATHPDKEFIYPHIPMELVPQRDSFAMYMAGPVMVLNVMLHALHQCSDREILAVCLDAAESGMNLKQTRNMLVHNPTSAGREFVLRFKGLNDGKYAVRQGNGADTSMSAQTLQTDGIGLALGPQEWTRIMIDPET
jgi:hypothetical protein